MLYSIVFTVFYKVHIYNTVYITCRNSNILNDWLTVTISISVTYSICPISIYKLNSNYGIHEIILS